MKRGRLVLIILCMLLIVGPMMISLNLWFSNASTESQLICLTNYNYVNQLNQKNTLISAKDLMFVRDYSNLDTETSLRIELTGVPQIDRVNFTLSNITAPNYTIGIDEDPESTESINKKIYAMSFKINQTCYLYKISLFLVDIPKTGPIYVDFDIYNGTWNPSHPDGACTEPNQSIYPVSGKNDYYMTDQTKQTWKTIVFDPVLLLNPSETDNQTFFMVLGQDDDGLTAGSKELDWGYTDDSAGYDYGPAFYNNSGTLELYDYDFSMRVYVSASSNTNPEFPFPSEINLQIRETVDVWPVQNTSIGGEGICVITENLGSSSVLAFDFDSTWFDTVSFNVTVEIYGTNLIGNILMSTLFQGYSLGSIFQTQQQNSFFLMLGAIGAVAVAGATGYRVNKKRKIPINAMRNMESILIDHNPSGTLLWSFDFISMQQDIALVSGFMSAIKSFLEEMKVGGLKRLGTEFGTFIREESQLLTATCITGEIGLDEELWIRGKLHEFLIKIEQSYYKELEDWKGNVAQFRESFPLIIGSLINLEKVQKLQMKKIEKLTKSKDKLQKKVNKYGAKLENLKSKYDSGEIDFKKYIVERYKTEAKYDKTQKDYIYASLFLQRVPSALEAERVTPQATKQLEKIQNRFFEVRAEIEELEKKEWQGVITSTDIERREKLQRELFALIEELGKFQEK